VQVIVLLLGRCRRGWTALLGGAWTGVAVTVAGLVALLGGALIGAASSPGVLAGEPMVKTAVAPATVQMKDLQFQPAILTVTAGTTVIWTNDDSSPHTVTDKARGFRSAALDSKETFSYTFAKPGEFTYFCTIHPMMVGKIIVKPGGPSS
jgi:plastocyanin